MDILTRRREPSPIFSTKPVKSKTNAKDTVEEEKELLRNGFYDDIVDGVRRRVRRCKIHRIPMVSRAIVEVVNAYSPSHIVVRIVNHIRDELVLKEPSKVVPLEPWELWESHYVLCPVEDRTYGRARILKIVPNPTEIGESLVQLILIDDGGIVWAKASSLASMDPDRCPEAKNFAYHPWQTRAVCLAGVSPKKTPTNPDRKWASNVRKRLQHLLGTFERFEVQPTTLSATCNDYRVATVVSLAGIRDEKENEQETAMIRPRSNSYQETDISSMLAGSSPKEVDFVHLLDGMKQHRYDIALSDKEMEEEKEEESNPFIEDFRRQAIPGWKETSSEEEEETCIESVMYSVQVEDMTLEWLRSEGYELDSHIFVSVEGDHTVSPWEFYGRPIKMMLEKTDNGDSSESNRVRLSAVDAMLKGNTVLQQHASVLDEFYSKASNRTPVDKTEIERLFLADKRIFLICPTEIERAEYTGAFQRVEVIKAGKTSATIRFIDSGGTGVVMYESLSLLHPDHAAWRALCLQLCVHGIKMESQWGESWQGGSFTESKKKSIVGCREKMREDLPLSLNILPESSIPRETFTHRSDIPHQRRGVLFVSEIRVEGVEKDADVIENMCSAGYARRGPNTPFPLKISKEND